VEVTWTRTLDGASALEYDAFVLASPAGHYAQTRAWADVLRAGRRVVPRFAMVRDQGRLVGAAMLLRPAPAGLPLPAAVIERGPVVMRVEELGRVADAIARSARRRAVAHIRLMPYWAGEQAAEAEAALRTVGFQDVHTPSSGHACTLRIAIGGKDDTELFAGKSKEQVRWRAKQAERAGASARRGLEGDWAALRALFSEMMSSQGKRTPSAAWWRALQRFASDDSRGAMYVCDYAGRVVSGCVALRHGSLATYTWGASVADKLPFSKAIPSLVAAIRWARDAGCSVFDLGGIPMEEDTDPKRNAIATFKLDFDKTRVRLVREHARWW
jgi:lipid II:glycine glycyltransferase (peptidoglycan interpeptide bridge formation enzyme)